MVVNRIIIYHLYCIHNIWYKKDSFCQRFVVSNVLSISPNIST